MTNSPVAWMVYTLDGSSVYVTDNPNDFTAEHRALPLYTQREWVGLSVNEARDFYESTLSREELISKIDEFLEDKNA